MVSGLSVILFQSSVHCIDPFYVPCDIVRILLYFDSSCTILGLINLIFYFFFWEEGDCYNILIASGELRSFCIIRDEWCRYCYLEPEVLEQSGICIWLFLSFWTLNGRRLCLINRWTGNTLFHHSLSILSLENSLLVFIIACASRLFSRFILWISNFLVIVAGLETVWFYLR
jgi:hypothetical protein